MENKHNTIKVAEEIASLVEKGKTKEACELLLKTRFARTGRLLLAQISLWEDSYYKGQTTLEQITTKRSVFNEALLVTANRLKKQPLFGIENYSLKKWISLSISF